MVNGEVQGGDYDRDTVNRALAETARDTLDKLCTEIIQAGFHMVRSKLKADAEQLELLELSEFPVGKGTELFVAPDMLHAPMIGYEPQDTLTLLLEPKELAPEQVISKQRMRLYLPTPPRYIYPDALQEEDMPPELYVEIASQTKAGEERLRYTIQIDESDPAKRYNIFEYQSAADHGKQVIFDAHSDKFIHHSLEARVPRDLDTAVQIFRNFGNYDVVPQTYYVVPPLEP